MTILAQGDRSSRVDLQACKLCINESANARGEAVCVLGAL
ncbi:hypothetical protein BCW_A0065, partial [Bacillus cereus W]